MCYKIIICKIFKQKTYSFILWVHLKSVSLHLKKRKIMNNHALHIILLSNIILLANAGGSEYCA